MSLPTTSAGAVRRTLDQVERDGAMAWRLTATRSYATDLDDAWNALTDPERLPRWFAPVHGDFEVGGRFQVEGNASGTIERCEPPRLLAVTWEMHGSVSWVVVTLEAKGEHTELVLEHVAHVPDAFWSEYGPGATGIGWDLSLAGLAMHVADVDLAHEDMEAWATQQEGRAFITACSDAWCEAAIAAGIDEDQARAAAGRSRDFYAPPG